MIPQEVRDLAAGIANDIERNGHWQGEGDRDDQCCVILNPTWNTIGAEVGCQLLNLLPLNGRRAAEWNDKTPTASVLATLRKIAAGETS